MAKVGCDISWPDGASRWITLYPIANKPDVFSRFVEFHAKPELQTGKKLKSIRPVDGGEYSSSEFIQYLTQRGIFMERTCAYTPKQHGMADRMNLTILNTIRTLVKHKPILKEFWVESLRVFGNS